MSRSERKNSNRSYVCYGKLKEIPIRESELTNDSKEGSIMVDGILIETYEDYRFVSIISDDVKVSVSAGYIANDLMRYAQAMEYPFELEWKNKKGKNVIV